MRKNKIYSLYQLVCKAPKKKKKQGNFIFQQLGKRCPPAVQAFMNFVPKLFIPTLIYQPFSALYLVDLPEEHSGMKHLANFPRSYYEISSIFNSVKSKQVIVFPRSDSLCCQNPRSIGDGGFQVPLRADGHRGALSLAAWVSCKGQVTLGCFT